MYTYMHTYITIFIYIHICIHVHVYTYIYIYVCVYVYIYISICISVCVYIYIYLCVTNNYKTGVHIKKCMYVRGRRDVGVVLAQASAFKSSATSEAPPDDQNGPQACETVGFLPT